MVDEPQSAGTEATSQTSRWMQLRYWIGGSIVLMLLLISPLMRTWYRRHQMIQTFFGGYKNHDAQQQGMGGRPFDVHGPKWARDQLASDISPFDSLKLARVYGAQPSELGLIADEHELRVLDVGFHYASPVDDSVLHHLKDLKLLQELTLQGISFRGDGLKHLKQAIDLRLLRVQLVAPVHGLKSLQELESLEVLNIQFRQFESKDWEENHDSAVATDAVRAVSNLRKLKELSLDVGPADPAAYEALTTNPSLTELHLGPIRLTHSIAQWLARIPKLRRLFHSRYRSTIEAGAIAAFNGSKLEFLSLDNRDEPLSCHELLEGVDVLPKLTTLHGVTPTTGEEIELLARCVPQLKNLSLGDTKPRADASGQDSPAPESVSLMSNRDLKPLVRMPHLEQLLLGRNGFTDEAVELLGQLKSLKEIDLSETDITDAGRSRLKQLLPNVRIGLIFPY